MTLQTYGRDWNKENKSCWNLCGGRENVLEKFLKDGSVFACMQRKQKTMAKLWERKQNLACEW
jgi:hypothetical protein